MPKLLDLRNLLSVLQLFYYLYKINTIFLKEINLKYLKSIKLLKN